MYFPKIIDCITILVNPNHLAYRFTGKTTMFHTEASFIV